MDSKQTRIFMSYMSVDWIQKPDVSDDKLPPEGLFVTPCKKGLVWSVCLSDDWIASLVNLICAAPMYGDVLLFFRSSDYHKVDKLKWERHMCSELSNREDVYNYIDDSLDDNHSEFIMPYESVEPFNAFMLFQLLANGFDWNKFMINHDSENGLLSNANIKSEILLRRDSIASKMDEYDYDFTFEASRKFFNKEGDDSLYVTSDKNWTTIFTHLVDMYLLPLLLPGLVNALYGLSEPCFLYEWCNYSDKYWRSFQSVYNSMNDLFLLRNEGGYSEYDRIWNRMYDFFDIKNDDIFLGRLWGCDRNKVCPCGSGLKWKKCHGKYYS